MDHKCIHTPFARVFKVIMAAFFQHMASYIEQNSTPAANNSCRLWTGPKTTNRKYGLISYKDPIDNRWKKKKAHRVSYMVSIIANMDLTSNLDCSHLCHNCLCVNALHISLEPHNINNNRQYCKNCNLCYSHRGYANCLLQLKIL